jgi:hypothetical protein
LRSDLPLTKTLDPADFDQLVAELALVDRYFTSAREQHPMRRWEYAMALAALDRWTSYTTVPSRRLVDVGGAGSPFHFMVMSTDWLGGCVVDPEERCDLEQYLLARPSLADAVTCLSVLEHVDDLDRFLYHLACLTAPGGLLFLTMDCCGHEAHIGEPDRHHFHWDRKRIFTLNHWEYLRLAVAPYGFKLLGEKDWIYHGDHVYDYSFASLALVKRS